MENLAEVTNISTNIMGTLSIELKVKGMRKPQDFILYPISKTDEYLKIQSDTRIAKVDLNGNGFMSKSHQSGAYFMHLNIDKLTPFNFSKSDWRQIVEYVGLTDGENIGEANILSNNEGAKSIFGLD